MPQAAVQQEQTAAKGSAALVAALRVRDKAAASFNAASKAYERGKEARIAAEASVAQFKDLDDRMANARAEMLKRGDNGQLPSTFADAVGQLRAAQEHLKVTMAALAVLEGEREHAARALRAAEATTALEAVRIVLREAADVAQQVRALHEQIWLLEDSVQGLEPMLNGLMPNLPNDSLVVLRAEVRKLLGLTQLQRPYVPMVVASRLAKAADKWRQRYVSVLDAASGAVEDPRRGSLG